MFERITIGFDGSPTSRAGLYAALELGGDDTLIRAVHVVPESSAPSAASDGVATLEDARSVLGEHQRASCVEVGGVTVASALRRFAATTDADLIVIGGADDDAGITPLRGSTAEALVHAAPVAVLVCTAEENQSIDHVAVLFDDTADGWRTIRRAGALAREHDAELTVVDVVRASDPLTRVPPHTPPHEHERRILHTIAAMVSDVPVVHQRLVEANSSAVLPGLPADVDLLVADAHPSVELLRLLRSVDPARRAPCPLLIMPAA